MQEMPVGRIVISLGDEIFSSGRLFVLKIEARMGFKENIGGSVETIIGSVDLISSIMSWGEIGGKIPPTASR